MNNKLKTKLAGTAVFMLVVFGAVATTYSVTQAQLISSGNTIKVSGTVSAVNAAAKTITISKDGSFDPISFKVNNNTNFGPNGVNSLSNVSVGDSVLINGTRVNSNIGQPYLATSIKENGAGAGYGNDTNKVSIATGVLNNKTPDFIVVQIGTTYVAFDVSVSTKFQGKTLKQLRVGDRVQVTGTDNGSTFDANKVVYESR